jgi:Arc/MetJ-type ribon-helix-helix transcriptional regulator
MNITLRPATRKLLEERMRKGGYGDADAAVRHALKTLGQVEDEAFEDLDADTQAAIRRAEVQSARGEGRPWKTVKEELRQRYLKA